MLVILYYLYKLSIGFFIYGGSDMSCFSCGKDVPVIKPDSSSPRALVGLCRPCAKKEYDAHQKEAKAALKGIAKGAARILFGR